jgi:hypothetical protein
MECAAEDSLVINVNMLLNVEEMEMSICQLRAEPERVAGCENTGPTPPAREIDQPKRVKPMIGPMIALAKNNHRSL